MGVGDGVWVCEQKSTWAEILSIYMSHKTISLYIAMSKKMKMGGHFTKWLLKNLIYNLLYMLSKSVYYECVNILRPSSADVE